MKKRLLGIILIIILSFSLIAVSSTSVKGQENDIEKDMKFFLHYSDENESARSIPGGGSTLTYFDTTTEWSDEKVVYNITASQAYFDWYLYPSLKNDITFSSFEFKIWARYISGAAPTGDATIIVSEVNKTGETVWSESFSQDEKQFASTPELKVYYGNLSQPHTFRSGSSIKFRFQFNAGAGKTFEFYYDTPQMDSRVELMTKDSMKIERIDTFDGHDDNRAVFDPNSSNKNISIRTSLIDPYGGYDVRWVNITLTDPTGDIIFDNKSMDKVSGTPLSYRNVYEIGWNYSGYPSGRYNITIWAIDNNGFNHYNHFSKYNYGNYSDVEETHFTIGRQYYANIIVLDSLEDELSGAEITATLSGNYVDSEISNDEGYVNLSLVEGDYELKITWQNTVVTAKSMTVDKNYTYSDPIQIKADVYFPEFRIIDSRNNSLENTAVYYEHPNGSSPPKPLITNDTGHVSLDLMAGGMYKINVRWRGIEVADENVIVDSNDKITIETDVYYINFETLDSQGEPLRFVQVVVYDSVTGIVHDFNVTDESGNTTSRLPTGNFDIEVYWNDKVVCSENDINITGDQTEQLECAVYYLDLKTVDSQDKALSDVHIVLKDESGYLFGSGYTDGSGDLRFKVAEGNFTLKGYWQGDLVYNDTKVEVEEDRSETLKCDVYYIDLTTVDSENKVISNVHLRLLDRSETMVRSDYTDDSGEVEFKVAGATYLLEGYWQDTLVYEDDQFIIDEDITESMDCGVHHLEIKTVDSNGEGLYNVHITVIGEDGNVYGSTYTNKSGVSRFRLPARDYNVKTRYKTTYYFSDIDMSEDKNITLQNSKTETIRFSDFPISSYRTVAFIITAITVTAIVSIILASYIFIKKYRDLSKAGYEDKGKTAEQRAEEDR